MLSLDELINVPSFVIDGCDYENTLDKDIVVDPENLQDGFAEQARMMAVYGFAYDRALDQEARLKIELEKIYALVDGHTRNNFTVSNTKFTEKMVHNTVITSVEYQKKQLEHQEAKLTAANLKSACMAIMHRKDMLIGLGANYRAQINAEPTLNIR